MSSFNDWTPELWELWTIDQFKAQRDYEIYGRITGGPLAPDWLQCFRERYDSEVLRVEQRYNGFEAFQQRRPDPPDTVPMVVICRCCGNYCTNINDTPNELNYEYFRRL